MMATFKRFLRHENGATAIEYGVIGMFMSLAVMLGMQVFSEAWLQFTLDYVAKVTAALS